MLKGQGELITRTEYLRWKYRNNDKVITQVVIAGHAFLWTSYLAKGSFLPSHLSDRLATIIERPVAVESFPWLLNHFPIVGTPHLINWSLFLSSLSSLQDKVRILKHKWDYCQLVNRSASTRARRRSMIQCTLGRIMRPVGRCSTEDRLVFPPRAG